MIYFPSEHGTADLRVNSIRDCAEDAALDIHELASHYTWDAHFDFTMGGAPGGTFEVNGVAISFSKAVFNPSLFQANIAVGGIKQAAENGAGQFTEEAKILIQVDDGGGRQRPVAYVDLQSAFAVAR